MFGRHHQSGHPQHRSGGRVRPFLIALTCGQLACSSEQPTESSLSQMAPAEGRHHPYLMVDAGATGAGSSASLKVSASLAAAPSVEGTGPKVLILDDAEGPSTAALASSIAAAGFQVTSRLAPENTWNGTNPALTGFAAVVHLNGATWNAPLPPAAQTALTSFVQNGGGFVAGQWNGYEATVGQKSMPDLVLQTYGLTGKEQECGNCERTYTTVPGQENHPVLKGIPSPFTFKADGHHAGPVAGFAVNPPTVLMRVSSGNAAVLVRDVGKGKVVNFSVSPNYVLGGAGKTLLDANVRQLYVNALHWTTGWSPDADGDGIADNGDNCINVANPSQADSDRNGVGDACEPVKPQTITFAALPDRVFGEQPFTIEATASSGLAVSFTATGKCSVSGATVTLTGAGSCTLTAQQEGNASYKAADPVSRSFTVAKAHAVITVGTEFVYDGQPKQAQISTDPTGLSGVTVSYTLNGVVVSSPTNVGTYQVLARLEHPDYEAADAKGTLTIRPALPGISWPAPAPITLGTALSSLQLNASATGVGGTPLTGTFVYAPAAGTRLGVGLQLLTVEFRPADGNYSRASASVQLSVTYRFVGFMKPVKNAPVVNLARAGRAIPISFQVMGLHSRRGPLAGAPVSTEMTCPTSAPSEELDDEDGDENSRGGLHGDGSKYTYVWKTDRSWAGSCRRLVLTLADGTTHQALFRFKSKPASKNGGDDKQEQEKPKDNKNGKSKAAVAKRPLPAP